MKKVQQSNNIDIVITGNVAWRDDLDWDVKVFYGIIRGLVKNDYYCCYASNEYLCQALQKDNDSTIRRYLKALKRAGVIVTDNIYVRDDYGELFYTRALVPTELYKKFEKKKDEMIDLKRSLKKCPMTVQKCTPTPCIDARQILNSKPCKKIITNNSEADINPQPPCKGGQQAEALIEPEQIKTFGEFGNVRLTESQREAFKREFGSELALALIEQLSAYIQSGVKRYRKKVDHYAILRDWALRRREPPAPAKVLIDGRDVERRHYSDDELNGLFTPLDDTGPPE